MALSQEHITPHTPMGASLRPEGATFRVWAPHALAVHVCGNFESADHRNPGEDNKSIKDRSSEKSA